MTATVLLLLSLWQDGQAATFTSDAITNMFPSQEGGAHCPSPTPRPTPPPDYKHHFFLISGLQALSALFSCSVTGRYWVFFQRGTTISFQEHFFFFFFLHFPLLTFSLCFKGSQCPQVSPTQDECVELAVRRDVCTC